MPFGCSSITFEHKGKVEHTVIEQIAFVAVEGSRVQFVTPNEFNIRRMTKIRDDAFWQDSLAQYFPCIIPHPNAQKIRDDGNTT